jgi:hypothetical protein
MKPKPTANMRLLLVFGAIVGLAILTEWVTIFFFGHVPPGYP